MEVALTGSSLAWTADGVQLPSLRRCSEIFASLFEEPKGGKMAQRRALRRKGSVLDANLAEVRQLEKKMGAGDKGRMEQYLTSVREIEQRTKQTEIEIMDELLAVNRERGTTLILVTHNLALAEQAEQIVHIAHGTIVA